MKQAKKPGKTCSGWLINVMTLDFPTVTPPPKTHILLCFYQQFTQEVESYKPTLDKLMESEESLFTSDFPTIQLCEHHVLKHKPTPESSTDPAQQYIESSVDKQVLPDWLERPGAPEAIEVGADLRGHYDKLRLDSGVKSDEASQLLEQVEAYESEYRKFSDWLGEDKAVMGSFTSPAITLEELRAQLQQVEVSGSRAFLSVNSNNRS